MNTCQTLLSVFLDSILCALLLYLISARMSLSLRDIFFNVLGLSVFSCPSPPEQDGEGLLSGQVEQDWLCRGVEAFPEYALLSKLTKNPRKNTNPSKTTWTWEILTILRITWILGQIYISNKANLLILCICSKAFSYVRKLFSHFMH